MNIRVNVFAAWRAAWLYAESWIAGRVTGRVVGVCEVNAGRGEHARRTRREHVVADLSACSDSVKFPDPKRRRERAGVRAISRPPFPFFDIWDRGEYAHAMAGREHAAGGAHGTGAALSALPPGRSGSGGGD